MKYSLGISSFFIMSLMMFATDLSAATASPATASAGTASSAAEAHTPESNPTAPVLYPLDGILAVIYHGEGTEIILRSDLRAPLDAPDNEPRTLRQAIIERLIVLDAKNLKIVIGDDDVDRFIAQIQKQHNISRVGMERLFNSRGYTYEEGRQQLLHKQYMEYAIEYRVKANKKLIIQKQDVEEYYRAHPDIEPPSYTLAMAFISDEEAPTKDDLELLIAKNDAKAIMWEEPFVVQEHELPQEKKYVSQEPAGKIVAVEKVDDGWQITQLITKTPGRERPLTDERYEEIAFSLVSERGQELLNTYEQELLAKATIRFLNPTMKLAR